jgi:hypothetical protein
MTDNVPLVDLVFNPDLLNPVGESFQLLEAITNLGRLTQTRQVDGQASEAAQQLVDDPIPQLAAGRYAVYEQNRVA